MQKNLITKWLNFKFVLFLSFLIIVGFGPHSFAQNENDETKGENADEKTDVLPDNTPNDQGHSLPKQGSNIIKDFKKAAAINLQNSKQLSAEDEAEESSTKTPDNKKDIKPASEQKAEVEQKVEPEQKAEVEQKAAPEQKAEAEAEQKVEAKQKSKQNNKKQDSAVNLNKVKYSEAIKIALVPLQKMTEQELVNLLLENTKNSKAHEFLIRYPKLMLFSVRLIKDKNALPSFATITDDKDKLIRFSIMMAATFLVAFVLKRILKKEGRSILEAVSLWFFRLVVMMSIRGTIILFVFNSELMPALKVASKTFL